MPSYARFGKRVLDLTLVSIACIPALPVIALAAVAIKLDSRGPVFHRAVRVGRGGRKFTFLKLRSMQVGAEELRGLLLHLNQAEGPAFKLHNDPRVTRVGRWLRKLSLDELPQLLHVLQGHMSLVGPRPPFPEEVERYEPWMLRRLSVRPGLTCLWQIRGRSDLNFEEWMRLDIEYVDRLSFWLDLRILALTVPAVISARGAY
ncbi:MAG: sugar transferase [Candidatus Eisenbacteria bacterium]|uniref:Sugar transferase n=1 Tax=Eiseniibacteriota bacterium TaxID=2212470 RepID=A0A538TE69_UNCEI|nr:MAG: sugar transferase [Candidatus Eisenbacteria bacterium]